MPWTVPACSQPENLAFGKVSGHAPILNCMAKEIVVSGLWLATLILFLGMMYNGIK